MRRLVSKVVRNHPMLSKLVDSTRAIAEEARDPAVRARRQAQRTIVADLRRTVDGGFLQKLTDRPFDKTVLIEGAGRPETIAFQAPVIWGFMLAGYRPVICAELPFDEFETIYQALGVEDFVYFGESLGEFPHPETERVLAEARASDQPGDIVYRDSFVMKASLSTVMRRTRRGSLDISTFDLESDIGRTVSTAMWHTDAMARVIGDLGPHALSLIDRGYVPSAQLFDVCLAADIPAFIMTAGHRDNVLMLKRFESENRDEHPWSLADETWSGILARDWSRDHDTRLMEELESCYRTGEWFSEVGTQFGKTIFEQQDLRERLGLSEGRKVAGIFPHLFWDATFFWGSDLFANYEEWFEKTLAAACANDSLTWLVKVHPGIVVKDRRDGYVGENSELAAIRRTVGKLPDHVHLISSQSDISTFALFPVLDYCVTVRGTIGIEAACFGIPVLTAGTGRYDRKGFTHDSGTAEEYLEKLATLSDIPPLDERQVNLARRLAYATLFDRPLRLRTQTRKNLHNQTASLKVAFHPPHADPARCEDICAIAEWIADGRADFMQGTD